MPRGKNWRKKNEKWVEDILQYEKADVKAQRNIASPKLEVIPIGFKEEIARKAESDFNEIKRASRREDGLYDTNLLFRDLLEKKGGESALNSVSSVSSEDTIIRRGRNNTRSIQGLTAGRRRESPDQERYRPPHRRVPQRPQGQDYKRWTRSPTRYHKTYTFGLLTDETTLLKGTRTGRVYARFPEGTNVSADTKGPDSGLRGVVTRQINKGTQATPDDCSSFRNLFHNLKM